MSIITAKGKDAKASLNKKVEKIDFKKLYIRLKDGESCRVRLLSAEDYCEYLAHASYANGIYTQPCIKPIGEKCALCEASDLKAKGFDGLYAKKRYLFAFADIDMGEIRLFDATKGQAQQLIAGIEQYSEDLETVAFVFKRTGNKVETNYSLSPILRLKAEDKEKFGKFDGVTVEPEFFESGLQPRTRIQQIALLMQAGFPVAQTYAADEVKAAQAQIDEWEAAKNGGEGVKPIPKASEDDNPDSVF
ncbi:hypothetical protein [Heliophilum fasciatum]|uniref:Bacteriophage T4 Gp32 single-stranded DNA-binding domain-containing protein n=1 Tax=Heliophilum fasciatum TaxID=35700 RepID=A0A4R2RL40_9FIRM|nr:hypothetical protein [Heliophilum fasciatum]MCW2279280.1 hypothetical protein [Heliophilum fasciatum]TCP60441.1 hypothetical protein EDD73_1371 [Heliophilum fasciatum]